VRDYIHVSTSPKAMLRRCAACSTTPGPSPSTWAGRGCSVLEVVAAYATASQREVPYEIVPRRPGDVAACWADPALAQDLLGWRAAARPARMCADSWRWQSMNPRGYEA